MPVVDTALALDPWAAAVLLHPHPERGGDRFNHVVDTLYRALPAAGVSARRFDFSSADIDTASSEATAALTGCETRPMVLVGYSFGADVATTVRDERLAGWFLVAPPLRLVTPARMVLADDRRPKALAVPEHDQFCPPERARTVTATWSHAAVEVVTGADHFLAGHSTAIADRVLAWLRSLPAPDR